MCLFSLFLRMFMYFLLNFLFHFRYPNCLQYFQNRHMFSNIFFYGILLFRKTLGLFTTLEAIYDENVKSELSVFIFPDKRKNIYILYFLFFVNSFDLVLFCEELFENTEINFLQLKKFMFQFYVFLIVANTFNILDCKYTSRIIQIFIIH